MTTSRATRLLTAPIALALAVGLAATVPAHASSTTRTDPRNDVFLASAGGGIDLAAVQLETLNRKKRIRVTFRLHSRALEGSLDKPGGMSARFIRNERTWRVVRVVTEEGVLRSEVCSYSRGPALSGPRNCSRVPVTQVDAKTYRAVVELEQVKEGATVLRWTAASMDLSNGDPVSDWLTAKDRGAFRWRL
jgi:hypothetical protein